MPLKKEADVSQTNDAVDAGDFSSRLQSAIKKAAAFKELADKAPDEARRGELCARAKFYLDLANEMRRLIAHARV